MRRLFFIVIFTLFAGSLTLYADTVKGVVIDKESRTPMLGATIVEKGTTNAVVVDAEGRFELEIGNAPSVNIEISFFAYKTIIIENVAAGSELLVEMEAESEMLEQSIVIGTKTLDNERALLLERHNSSVSIENIGAKEMGVKGISNVQEGVKKLSGVSIASSGQLIVRGLGDRYSITTLNGMPIASPNPDNKLIPLDIFPASTIQNITVSKVFRADTYADYSGAHVDISTKEGGDKRLLQLSVGYGGNTMTIGKAFYMMDSPSLFATPKLPGNIYSMSRLEFDDYIKGNNPFRHGFDVARRSIPGDMKGSFIWTDGWDLPKGRIYLMAAANISNGYQNMYGNLNRTLEASGTTVNEFYDDSYEQLLKTAGLFSLGYRFENFDKIEYTFFYARNAGITFMNRHGYDREDNDLVGLNSTEHIYEMQNHQLSGFHTLSTDWILEWKGSASLTGSSEPDRRQVMYARGSDGQLRYFKNNSQETMRYWGNLDESEYNGEVSAKYTLGETLKLKAGVAGKYKTRDYSAVRFYYDVNKLNSPVDDIFTPSVFINQENISSGLVGIDRSMPPTDTYGASSTIFAGYVDADYNITDGLLLNLGLRYEYSSQAVDYHNDQGIAERSVLTGNDLFPAMNLRYNMGRNHNLRLSASRTVTRPSFIEMSPFLYQEAYGSAQIRGNADIRNGYNYNLDLRYEWISGTDLISMTLYYKYLDSPIERIQMLSGGTSVQHSFQNADNGMAAGVEFEIRKKIVKDFYVNANVAYMYTDVILPEGGSYTDARRALQGASPWLANADLSYTPQFRNGDALALALTYNYQGERIHAVGVSGLGNVIQDGLHTLDFTATYNIGEHCSLNLRFDNILDSTVSFRQEVISRNTWIYVEKYRPGVGMQVGFTYKF